VLGIVFTWFYCFILIIRGNAFLFLQFLLLVDNLHFKDKRLHTQKANNVLQNLFYATIIPLTGRCYGKLLYSR